MNQNFNGLWGILKLTNDICYNVYSLEAKVKLFSILPKAKTPEATILWGFRFGLVVTVIYI